MVHSLSLSDSKNLEKVLENSKTYFDLTNNDHYNYVIELANQILKNDFNQEKLEKIIEAKIQPLATILAAFLALSKLKIQKIKTSYNLAILTNLIHEHNRLRNFSWQNPNGENSLFNKLKQLHWLFDGTPVNWQLIYVSGGCSFGSDQVLKDLIKLIPEEDKQKVKHLQIQNYKVDNKYIKNQKGGEIIFGIRSVLKLPEYPDLGDFDGLLFTDADMTFDLGQIGIGLEKIIQNDDLVVAGNRTHKDSILIKNPTRPGPGVLMYRHLQRRIGSFFFEDLNLLDTQCPWKMFSIDNLKKMEKYLDSMDWAIDTDLIGSAIFNNLRIEQVPVTAIDSEIESHGHAISGGPSSRLIYLITSLIQQIEKYNLPTDQNYFDFAKENVKLPSNLAKILENLTPEKYSNQPNSDFGKAGFIDVKEYQEWYGKL